MRGSPQIAFLCITLLALTACRTPESRSSAAPTAPAVKNIILLLGDGMGVSQVAQAMLYADQHPEHKSGQVFRELYSDAVSVLVTTGSADSPVTDSAAAATAMACGFKTNNDLVGMDPSGKSCNSILRLAHAQGKATGLVSNMRIAHATPAAFAATAVHRGLENDMAAQMIDEGVVDIMLNGGGRHLTPQGTKLSDISECSTIPAEVDGKSKRKDDRDLIAEAKAKDYAFACTKDQLQALGQEQQRVLGIFANNAFPAYPERKDMAALPSLEDMTHFALERLSQDADGFFLMVEAGMIDYAGHANDAGTQLQETLDFTHSIRAALDFAKGRTDTLVLVTADHETGGYGLSYKRHASAPPPLSIGEHSYTPRYHTPAYHQLDRDFAQRASFDSFIYNGPHSAEEFQELVFHATRERISLKEAQWVLEPRAENFHNHEDPGDLDPFCGGDGERQSNRLAHVLAKRSFSTWSTGNHTHEPVNLFVYGSPQFTQDIKGLIDNTEIFKLMRSAMNSGQQQQGQDN